MYPVAEDLEAELTRLIAEVSHDRLVVVDEHPEYKGELCFQVFAGEQAFFSRYHTWVSRYLVLVELANLTAFVTQLERDGWIVTFGPTTAGILADYERWCGPLEIPGYILHPFQRFSLNRALEMNFQFLNWCAGGGKSFCSAAGAKELFARNEIDLVIACTPAPLKIGLSRFFDHAGLDVIINDGTPARRKKVYREEHQGFVLNYERLRVDEGELTRLVTGKRVLWVLDEVQKILAGQRPPNRSRKAFDRMVRTTAPRVWPMSATIVDGDPLKYRDVYSFDITRNNPLGTPVDFERRYAERIRQVPIQTPGGRRISVTFYDWDKSRLPEVRHRAGRLTHSARKTDPGLAEVFKGLQTIESPLRLSDEDRQLHDIIVRHAEEAWQRGETLAPHYRLMRYACLTPLALAHTDEEIGQQIAAEHPHLITSANSAKIAMINELLEGFRGSGDKVVMFCHWVGMGLHLIKDHLTVPYLEHHGDQTAEERQASIDAFQSDPNITALFSSDAGAHGLNLTAARIVLQTDPVYSFDLAIQRASRIDRADAHLDGLTNIQLLTEDSVEERIWEIQQQRRDISAAVQGTIETLSYGRAARSEAENLPYLVLGHD